MARRIKTIPISKEQYKRLIIICVPTRQEIKYRNVLKYFTRPSKKKTACKRQILLQTQGRHHRKSKQGNQSRFSIIRYFLANHGRILPALTYNGRDPLNVNAGRILPWFARKCWIVEKLEWPHKNYLCPPKSKKKKLTHNRLPGFLFHPNRTYQSIHSSLCDEFRYW